MSVNGARHRYDSCATALLLLSPVILIAALRVPGGRVTNTALTATVQSSIDPNEAPWWELTILPGVGETKARRIAAHRYALTPEIRGDTQSPPFRSAEDLTAIHGIGVKTAQRVAPYLRFDGT